VSPEGEYATLLTAESTFTVDRQAALDKSQILSVLSKLPETRMLGSSGLKARQLTLSKCPLIVDSSAPVSKFQSLILLSREQLARVLSLGWNTTPITELQNSEKSVPPLTHFEKRKEKDISENHTK
jgi:hypothetical protein